MHNEGVVHRDLKP